MTGCEILKCPFYIDGKCTDENYVDKRTGEEMCSKNSNAVPREEFEDWDEEAKDEERGRRGMKND